MIKPILTWPASILKQHSDDVIDGFGEPLQNAVLTDMWDTLKDMGGVGLSAVQIGMLLNVFILDRAAFDQLKIELPEALSLEGDMITFVNPVITEASKEVHETWEGCLSFPEIYLKFDRPKSITVSYKDALGKECSVVATDFLARAICHEIDHLNGVLMTRYVGSLKRQMVEKKLMKRRRL